MKPLERIFFLSCVNEQKRVYDISKRELRIRDIANIFSRLGFSHKQLMYYVRKWCELGFYEYGFTFDLGWFCFDRLTGEYLEIYNSHKLCDTWKDDEFAEYLVKSCFGRRHITNYALREKLGIGDDREFFRTEMRMRNIGEFKPILEDRYSWSVLNAYINSGNGQKKLCETAFFRRFFDGEASLMTLQELYEKAVTKDGTPWKIEYPLRRLRNIENTPLYPDIFGDKCDFCHDIIECDGRKDQPNPDRKMTREKLMIIKDLSDGTFRFYGFNKYHYEDDACYINVVVGYCPKCGRKLEKE